MSSQAVLDGSSFLSGVDLATAADPATDGYLAGLEQLP
jgi:hypothetical protein